MDEVYAKAARDVVADLEIVLCEPKLDTEPADLARYRWLDRRWYARATKQLERRGFRFLRDIDATAVTAKGAPPSCVRVLLSDDGCTAAALYQSVPRSPRPLMKALLWLTGHWHKPRVVELSSYTEDGRVLSTSNQGGLNQFSFPPNVSRRSLSLGAPVKEVWSVHRTHLEGAGTRAVRFYDFEGLEAAREAQRAKQNAWRLEVGILPEELDRLLAPHGAHGAALRPHIERALAERRPR